MWLFLHPDGEYGVSDLAGLLEVPLSTLHREVVRLDAAGLLSSRALGRNRLVRANTAHPAAKALTLLLEITFGPRVVIAEEFAILGAKQVVIFGTWAARYAGEVGSPPHDIDVLVVGNVDRAEVYDAADRAQSRLGIEVNPVVRSVKQWDDPADPLVAQVKASAYATVLDARELVDARWSGGTAARQKWRHSSWLVRCRSSPARQPTGSGSCSRHRPRWRQRGRRSIGLATPRPSWPTLLLHPARQSRSHPARLRPTVLTVDEDSRTPPSTSFSSDPG